MKKLFLVILFFITLSLAGCITGTGSLPTDERGNSNICGCG